MTTSQLLLGHKLLGTGPQHVLVVHDFFCDTTSYEGILPYLDTDGHTYCLADLRGYGKSMELTGEYTVEEVVADLIALADHLGWKTFQAIGHSMSGQFIQYLALKHPERVTSLVAITPVPPCGSPQPPEVAESVQAAARGNETIALGILQWITGGRMGEGFVRFKVRRWYATSTESARLGYLKAFTQTNFSKEVNGLKTPMLVIVGENDATYSAYALKQSMLSHYPNSALEIVPNASHYPMQESPPYLMGLLERFRKGL